MKSVSPWGVASAIGLAVIMTAAFRTGAPEAVPYPEGYRRWMHVKSALTKLGQPDQGFHHIYANEKAIEGYQTGRFPDGAVLAFDRLNGSTGDGTIREGARNRVDVMHKDSARFAATGGWGYERFLGETERRRWTSRPAKGASTATCRSRHRISCSAASGPRSSSSRRPGRGRPRFWPRGGG